VNPNVDPGPRFTNAATRGASPAVLARRGIRGGRIAPHRAMIGLKPTPLLAVDLLLLPAIFALTVFIGLDRVVLVWRAVMDALRVPLGLGEAITTSVVELLPGLTVAVPAYSVGGAWPTAYDLRSGWVLTAALAVAGILLRGRFTPLGYLLRSLAILQLSAQVWFSLAAPPWPYSLATYGVGLLSTGIVILLLIPFLVAATFFIFDFRLWQKLALTALLLVHLAVLFPLQATLHVWIVHRASFLAMPVLFLVFGVLLDVFVYVALYGWAMSWRSGRELDALDRRPPPTPIPPRRRAA
jgi:hypothetical protein